MLFASLLSASGRLAVSSCVICAPCPTIRLFDPARCIWSSGAGPRRNDDPAHEHGQGCSERLRTGVDLEGSVPVLDGIGETAYFFKGIPSVEKRHGVGRITLYRVVVAVKGGLKEIAFVQQRSIVVVCENVAWLYLQSSTQPFFFAIDIAGDSACDRIEKCRVSKGANVREKL
jgi:hypothetical protein